MKTAYTTLIALTILLLNGCSLMPEKIPEPEWVTGSSTTFPSTLYFTGHGSATDLNGAKEAARSAIATQLGDAIQAHRQQNQNHSTGEMASNINHYTSRTLQGIEIGGMWHDKANKRHHVLAVLSRNRAQQQFRQDINRLDSATAQQISQLELTTLPLAKAALFQKAIELQQQRNVAQVALQIIDENTPDITPSTTALSELQNNRNAILNKTKIATSASGELQDDLQHQLSSATSAAGFFLSEENPDYTLNISATLDPLIMQRGWYWLRGTLELNMKDSNGKDVGIKRWPLKVSATTIEQTRQRLLDDTNTILSGTLINSVLEFSTKSEPAIKK